MKALVGKITDLQYSTYRMTFEAVYHEGGVGYEIYSFDVLFSDGMTEASIKTAIETELLSHAVAQSYTMVASDIVYVIPNFITANKSANVTNAPADAPTNLNVITTLLGTLVGEVNSTNSKQNEIASKLNSVLACLKAHNIMASS